MVKILRATIITPSSNCFYTKHIFSVVNHWTPVCQDICSFSVHFFLMYIVFSVADVHSFHMEPRDNQTFVEQDFKLI